MLLKVLITTTIFLFTISILLTTDVIGTVYISEVLPAPVSEYSSSEWIEVHNSSDELIDLSGWSIAEKELKQDTIIKPNDYLIITKNLEEFIQNFGEVIPNIIELSITLSNSGKTIDLIDNQGKVIDTITYGNSSNHRNISYERIEEASSDLIRHCYYHTAGIQNSNWENIELKEICPNIELSIDSIEWSELTPFIYTKEFFLRVSGEADKDTINWYFDGEYINLEDFISLELDKLQSEHFKVEISRNGNTLYEIEDNLEIYPLVYPLEFSISESEFELVYYLNSSQKLSIDLNNTILYVNEEQCEFKGYNQKEESFSLSYSINCLKSGINNVELSSPEGLLINSTNISLTKVSPSKYKYVDSNWILIEEELSSQPIEYNLQISEVFPSPDNEEKEWIEIYNWGNDSIDLSNLILKDKTGEYSLEGLIDSKSHIVFDNLSISLNNSGDAISLITENGKLIDEFVYSDSEKGRSISRIYDDTTQKYSKDIYLESDITPMQMNSGLVDSLDDDANTESILSLRPASEDSRIPSIYANYKFPNFEVISTLVEKSNMTISLTLWNYTLLVALLAFAILIIRNMDEFKKSILTDSKTK